LLNPVVRTLKGSVNLVLRTWFEPIVSIDEMRCIVGCKDAGLEEWLLKQDWGYYEYKFSESRIKKLISGQVRQEYGSWAIYLPYAAKRRKLIPRIQLPFGNSEWGQTSVWEDYIKCVKRLAGKSATELLEHLEMGRPLKFKNMNYDDHLYSWLTNDEIQLLHLSLDQIEVTEDKCREKFHKELVATLALCCEKKCDLFMGAT
jgi:hypothetical protein